jgi:dienelactone hydrolase
MGYCLGGALALHAARLGLDLRGVASFHGSLGKTHPAQKGDVKARVLVCHGEDDSFVSAEEQAGFRQEMDHLGVDYRFIAYPGAKHGFTNPDATENGRKYNLPLAYNEAVDRESWQEMKAFWADVLG